MKILLIDLPNHPELIGKRINVKRQGGFYHYEYQDIPHIRVFKGSKIKTENKVKWVYWFWEPESDINKLDCGYSGVSISELYKDSYLEV